MGRFSPTVLPRAVNPLAVALDEFAEGRETRNVRKERERQVERQEQLDEERREEARRRRERQQRLDEQARRMRELNLALRGIRSGERPTQVTERERPGVFEGVDPSRSIGEGGVVPEQPERASSGPQGARFDRTGGLLQGLEELRQRGRPKMIAPPGAFVPGRGFTTEPLFESPAARMGVHREATTRETPVDPRDRQLTDEHFLDFSETPEAHEAAAEAAERQDFAGALEGLKHLSPEQRRALAAGVSESVVFPDEEEQPDEGIVFTEEELRAAGVPEDRVPVAMRDPVLARQLVMNAARPTGRGEGPGINPTSLLVAQRQRALGAARAVAQIDPQDFFGRAEELTSRQREVLRLWGYRSIDELSADMRRLGVAPEDAGAGPGPGAGPGDGGGEGGGEPAWKVRARELREEGHGEQAIIAKLKQEGLIR